MLKFSVHLSSSESDLRTDELSDTSSAYSSSLRDGDHSCHECDKRKRALSKERTKLSRHHSRSREGLNYNSNRCNSDATTPSVTTNSDTSDGQYSVTCTTSTSNSEMSSVSNSLYKRWQLRSRSKSKDASSRRGRRNESPESSSPTDQSYNDNERRGRRGLWELQKAASRVIGPESRLGRWVGKLRSRSSEARLGSLKSRYSGVPNWGGWNLEDDDSKPVEDRLVSPTLMVNDSAFNATEHTRQIYGKKILRSKSTEAINWTIEEEHECRNFRRQIHVRESFEKAMRNRTKSPDNVSKPRLHAMFESEPNLTKGNMYNIQRRQNESRKYQDGVEKRSPNYTQNMRRCTSQNIGSPCPQYCLENDNRRQQRYRPGSRSSRSVDRDRERPVSYPCENSPTHLIYQKSQRPNQPSTIPRHVRQPNSQRFQQSPDSVREINREAREQYPQREVVPYETIQFVNSESCNQKHDPGNRKRDSLYNDSQQNDSNRYHRGRTYKQISEEKPVLARYIPPRVSQNEGSIKQCTLKRVPVQSVNSTSSSSKNNTPPNYLFTNVSASCSALQELNGNNNRVYSDQELKRRSLTSLLSIESADSGTGFSDGGRLSPNSDKERECLLNRKRTERSRSNVSSYSSDSGYISPTSAINTKKGPNDLETVVVSNCFGQNAKETKKPLLHTSDYESESGYDDLFAVVANSSRIKFQQTAMRLESTEHLQESDADQGPLKQQGNRRSLKKGKANGSRNRSSTNSTTLTQERTQLTTYEDNTDISTFEPTTKVRARLNHKAMSSAEMSVRRGDTLYLNRNNLAVGVRWVLAYSTSTGDTGLVPTVILSSRMENLI